MFIHRLPTFVIAMAVLSGGLCRSVLPATTPEFGSILHNEECTIAVITGAITADGRPLFWKNRDSGAGLNEVVYFDDGDYSYITLTTIADTLNARLGINEIGFAVMNSISRNLPDTLLEGSTNGEIMKQALQSCACVDDFDLLLFETNFPGRCSPSNMGVIDAFGGAAIFEADNHGYVKFDANDPQVAPDGFLARANFSFSADTTDVNTWRYHRAYELIVEAATDHRLDVRAVLQASRDLATPWVDPYPLPYEGSPPGDLYSIGYVDAAETINRSSSVAFGVIRGVRPGEDPRFSTFYASTGQPVVTIVLPVWVAAGRTPVALDGDLGSALCSVARGRTVTCYNMPFRPKWLNTYFLVGENGEDGFLVRVNQIEDWLLAETEGHLQSWYEYGVEDTVMAAVEHELSQLAFDEYQVPVSLPAGFESPDLPALAHLTCWPNPMGEATAVSYLVPRGSPIPNEIGIWDISGRLVRRLCVPGREGLAGGQLDGSWGSTMHWDGRDGDGRAVATGVYYLRPAGAHRRQTRRIVVIR